MRKHRNMTLLKSKGSKYLVMVTNRLKKTGGARISGYFLVIISKNVQNSEKKHEFSVFFSDFYANLVFASSDVQLEFVPELFK
jgi:hypothetical protein